MPDLAGDSRYMGKRAALRKADEKIPIFEEIKLPIEATEVEKRVPRDQECGQRDVIVD